MSASRRDFLKTSAAASGGLKASPAPQATSFPGATTPARMVPIRACNRSRKIYLERR